MSASTMRIETAMSNEKVFQMNLQKVYPLLVAKAEKKGRTRAEVDQVTCWLTGYSQEQLAALLESGIPYGDFFRQAPSPHPNREKVKLAPLIISSNSSSVRTKSSKSNPSIPVDIDILLISCSR